MTRQGSGAAGNKRFDRVASIAEGSKRFERVGSGAEGSKRFERAGSVTEGNMLTRQTTSRTESIDPSDEVQEENDRLKAQLEEERQHHQRFLKEHNRLQQRYDNLEEELAFANENSGQLGLPVSRIPCDGFVGPFSNL